MKIMKQLLDSEMKLIKGKKINKAFLFYLFFLFIGITTTSFAQKDSIASDVKTKENHFL